MNFKLVIDGRLVEGASSLDVIDPASGKRFATCARADGVQLEQAIAAAKRSFPVWAALSHAQRKEYLDRLCEMVELRKEEFAVLLTREQGKPLAQARAEIGSAIARLRYFAALDMPVTVLRENDDEKIIEHRTPLGVVAAITPWNFPFSLLINKLGPALSAGNTMVAKPAPTTPLTTLLLGAIAAEVLPRGVFNVIVDANELGAKLTSHPDIAKIGFTGSTSTGKLVMQSAAGSLKRVTLELGGNDAAIILDDADIKSVAKSVFAAAMLNAGQVCLAAKRVYVPRGMYHAFCEELAQLANNAVVGDGSEHGTEIGPLQNQQQFEKVLALIETTKKDGRILAGGKALDRPGFFIAPTIVCDLSDGAELVREEQFGPVIPVLAYDTVDEAIARANDTVYGLGGTIWTTNYARGAEVAMRLDTGTVWVNKHLDLPSDIPFGGAKQSGIGRENGIDALKEVTQGKIVNISKTAVSH
ncbi:aldehyde dehydrogenase family protein [Tardiphaga sp.]|uniref:aldehyde dehydrogenase family protein n=1 Tax=Tardiphaga sp. TaxID=1926292 RepID=UPI0026081D5D|nr:aldehyde dehydrogenase family protein [Tardiphaga sp.]MDB5621354.1 benzaldehyde-derivative dehydrogenase [Tardiphaga sp.]